MTHTIHPSIARQWLFDGDEIAFVDVRENGQYGDGHPLFAVSIPYSRFEKQLLHLVPNPDVRLVLFDNDDGIATLAAARASELGYQTISIMAGGVTAWLRAGYTLYQGTNVPSKTFGELLELKHHTPNLNAEQLAALKRSTPNHVIVDSRPFDEFKQFNIPGGICCPNGEVTLRIGELAPDPQTTIVVNCAGRTRSILGAETLRAFGVPNLVYALQNGTQGWLLAGLQREEGAQRNFSTPPAKASLSELQAKARACSERTGFAYIAADQALAWLNDNSRTTYLFDVRSEAEYQADGINGSRHVLGGQLVQETDQHIGVRGSRVILMDDEMVRAPMMANWIYQLGYEVAVLDGGIDALRDKTLPQLPSYKPQDLTSVQPSAAMHIENKAILDLRPLRQFRKSHIDGAVWTIRPLLSTLELHPDTNLLLIVNNNHTAALAAQRLNELGFQNISQLTGDEAAWLSAGFHVTASTGTSADARFDELVYHLHQRNPPNSSEAAANAYLSWEIGLVDQLDAEERAAFRLSDNHLPNKI